MKFSDFCKQNGIKHICTSLFHPQLNGRFKQFLGIFKRALQKFKWKGTVTEILKTFLTGYRATPNTDTANSSLPAEVLSSRKIWLYRDIIRRSTQKSHQRIKAMEQQFSRHHTARSRNFKPDQQILTKDNRNKEVDSRLRLAPN